MTLARLAALVQREGQSNDTRLEIVDLTADEPKFLMACQGIVSNFFEVNQEIGGYNNLTSEELRAIARWLEVSPVEFWRATYTLLKTCSDPELTELMKQTDVLPGDREANLEQLVESWQPSWVPAQFTLDKKRGKSK